MEKKSNVQLSEAGKEFCTKTRQNQDRFPTLFPAVNSCRVFPLSPVLKMHLRLLLLYGGTRALISVGARSEMHFTVSTVEEDKAAEVTFMEVQGLKEEQELRPN